MNGETKFYLCAETPTNGGMLASRLELDESVLRLPATELKRWICDSVDAMETQIALDK